MMTTDKPNTSRRRFLTAATVSTAAALFVPQRSIAAEFESEMCIRDRFRVQFTLLIHVRPILCRSMVKEIHHRAVRDQGNYTVGFIIHELQ